MLTFEDGGSGGGDRQLPDTLEQPLIILSADPESDQVTPAGANNGAGEADLPGGGLP